MKAPVLAATGGNRAADRPVPLWQKAIPSWTWFGRRRAPICRAWTESRAMLGRGRPRLFSCGEGCRKPPLKPVIAERFKPFKPQEEDLLICKLHTQ
jgi:hypothetical protein